MLSSLAMVRFRPSTPIHLPTHLSVGGVAGTRVACTEAGAGLGASLDSWLQAVSRTRAERTKSVFFIAARPWLKSATRGQRCSVGLESGDLVRCSHGVWLCSWGARRPAC